MRNKKSVKKTTNKKPKNKSISKTKKRVQKYNLVWLNLRGGWVSFTAHLANKCGYNLYKITNKTETKKRQFGYGAEYQNLSIQDLVKLPNLMITCIDKKFYEFLPKIKSATIVIHDPTELKEPVLEALKRFKIITIRETVQKLLKKDTDYQANFFIIHF